jgi:nucleoside-diphosphate-sugar epimerase
VVQTAGRDPSADVHFDLAEPFLPPSDIGRFEVVIHCAASFAGNSLEEAVHNEVVNSIGSLRALQLAQGVGCRHLIYVSSISIYDHPENQYFGSYGLSKKHGQENLQWSCEQSGMGFTALVASQLYDAAGTARHHQPLLYHIVDCARDGTEVRLFGRVSPRRNFVLVDDFAAIVQDVIDKAIYGTFPVLANESPTLVEVAEKAFHVFGSPVRIRIAEDQPNTGTVYLPADRTIFDRIGWNRMTDLESGLTLIRDQMGLRPT